jgi:hypothetical protein
MRTKLSITLLSLIITLSGCAAVTITKTGESNLKYHPDYEESKHFFLWGLVGEHRINVTEICTKMPTIQMQTKFSSWDVFYSAITLGIYLPRTAKVWCEREGDS